MITLQDVKDNCFIDEESHWIFRSGRGKGEPSIQAPNFTKDPSGQTHTTQKGARAVRHITTGLPIRKGWHVWARCGVARCINPECIVTGSRKVYGAWQRQMGLLKGQPNRIAANRRNSDKQRKVTRAVADDILHSNESNLEAGARLQLHPETVSRVRRGITRAPGNVFAGLMR